MTMIFCARQELEGFPRPGFLIMQSLGCFPKPLGLAKPAAATVKM
jgi:hypothetical protein